MLRCVAAPPPLVAPSLRRHASAADRSGLPAATRFVKSAHLLSPPLTTAHPRPWPIDDPRRPMSPCLCPFRGRVANFAVPVSVLCLSSSSSLRSSIFEHNSSQRSQVDESTHETAADSRRCAGATSTPALLHQERNGRQGAQSAVVRLVHAPCVARGTSTFCSSFVSGSATAAGRLRHRHRDWQQQ